MILERLDGLKKCVCFEFAAFFLSPNWRAKKRGNFKTNNLFSPSSHSYIVLALAWRISRAFLPCDVAAREIRRVVKTVHLQVVLLSFSF